MKVKELSVAHIQNLLSKGTTFITGAPRSGTSLVGKIVSTFKGVAYSYEPPTLYQIFAQYVSGSISLDAAQSLLRVYLTEDIFLENAHGRGVNLRPADDSLILNSITWAELNERWQKVQNRNDAIRYVAERQLSLIVKMPNIMDGKDLISCIAPDQKHVLVVRNGFDVISSIVTRGWVSKDGLADNLWPYQAGHSEANEFPVPYWLPEEQISAWQSGDDFTRGALMWIYHAKQSLMMFHCKALKQRLFVIDYGKLIQEPMSVMTGLADYLNLEHSSLTAQRIAEIRPGRKNNVEALFEKVSSSLVEEVSDLSSQLSAL